MPTEERAPEPTPVAAALDRGPARARAIRSSRA
jgi:hypothetical protein